MVVSQTAPDTQHMHDRKDAGSSEPGLGLGHAIGEQPVDVRMALAVAARPARTDETVDVTFGQHGVQGAARWCLLQANAVRKFQSNLLRPPWGFHAASDPDDVFRCHSVVSKDRPRPHIGCELILGNSDAPAFEVFGFLDAPVSPDIDRGMSERTAEEHRYGYVRWVRPCQRYAIGAERKLADIAGAVAKGVEEHFFRRLQHDDRFDTVNANPSIEYRSSSIVVTNCDG